MNVTLLKPLVALLPTGMLVAGSIALWTRTRGLASLLQVLGAAGMLIVVLAHICEALRLVPAMGWGEEHSVGHYLDLGSAIGGFTLFSVGYLFYPWTHNRR